MTDFVVLGIPSTTTVVVGLPLFVLRHSVETDFLLVLRNLDNGGDESDL
jgi:hypothetical protein